MAENCNEMEIHKALILLLEFQTRSFWEATGLLAKGMAFYLAIMAAVVGYVLTKTLEPLLRAQVLIGSAVTSVLFFVAATSIVWGAHKNLLLMERLLSHIAGSSFTELGLAESFSKRRRIIAIVWTCSCSVGLLLIIGLLKLI